MDLVPMETERSRPGPVPPRPGVRRRASAHAGPGRQRRWQVDTRVLAAVLGVLAVLGLIGAALSFVVDVFVAPWRLYTADGEESLHLVAGAIGLAGAFQLSRGASRARVVVLAGLGLNVLATLVFGITTLGRLETLAPLVLWLVLAVLTVVVPAPGRAEETA